MSGLAGEVPTDPKKPSLVVGDSAMPGVSAGVGAVRDSCVLRAAIKNGFSEAHHVSEMGELRV